MQSGSWLAWTIVAVSAVPLAFFGFSALYLFGLMLAAVPGRRRVNNSSANERVGAMFDAEKSGTHAGRMPRFTLLVPAHNEELLLGDAIDALCRMDYPRDRYSVVVIADNCSDHTADVARDRGALVLERFDTDKIGKGFALEWALDLLLMDAPPDLRTAAEFDAVVILDADTVVAGNLLSAFAVSLLKGERALQARYDVLNKGDSWRTKLMTCALGLAHVTKPLGREQLRLSDGLKGNGMCFARSVVATAPWSGASITEDIEYTLRLCRAGIRVAFVPETTVWAQMPTTAGQATTQRRRWEGGRYRLLFTEAPKLLLEAMRRRNFVIFDRAVELIVPPFAEMFAIPAGMLAGSLMLAHIMQRGPLYSLAWAWLDVLVVQAAYLVGGIWVARIPAGIAASLAYAPIYMVWKFGLYAVMSVTGGAGGWKRTARR